MICFLFFKLVLEFLLLGQFFYKIFRMDKKKYSHFG